MKSGTRKLLVVLNILLAVLGMALAGWAAHNSDDKKEMLNALGGSLVGAGLAGMLTGAKLFNLDEHIADDLRLRNDTLTTLLRECLEPGFRSQEQSIAQFRRVLYHYYVSRQDGKYIWRLGVVDFSASLGIGRLIARAHYPTIDGVERFYRCEALVIDERFVMTVRDIVGDESADICVFPFMTKANDQHRCGLGFLETLDHRDIAAPQILSYRPIKGWTNPGTIHNRPDVVRELNERWSVGFRSLNDLVIVEHDEEPGARQLLVNV